jgi:hypothetical protein
MVVYGWMKLACKDPSMFEFDEHARIRLYDFIVVSLMLNSTNINCYSFK